MKRIGKFTLLRNAFKAARDAYRTEPTPANRAVRDYLERARVASILLSELRKKRTDQKLGGE